MSLEVRGFPISSLAHTAVQRGYLSLGEPPCLAGGQPGHAEHPGDPAAVERPDLQAGPMHDPPDLPVFALILITRRMEWNG